MKGSGSRWDGLRDNDEAAKPSTRRHIRREDENYLPRDARHIRASSKENASSSCGSWRRLQKTNSELDLSAKDEKVRSAIERLKSKLSIYAKSTDSNGDSKSDNKSIGEAIKELSIAFLGNSDPSCFLERTSECNGSPDQSRISDLVLWEGADATIRSLRQLHPSKSHALLTQMLTVTAVFLQMIYDNIQNTCSTANSAGTFPRPKSMTNLRLCECVSILLDYLSCDVELLDTDQMSLIGSKELLFTCLAKILSISTMLGTHASNGKNIRSLLFPWGAEKTANLVVKQSVLPFVHTVMGDSLQMTCTMKIKHCHHAMECIYLLLKDPSGELHSTNHQLSKHAAAILAPLVIDVDPNGQENQRPNPLRSSTLNAILTFWHSCYQKAQETHPNVMGYNCEVQTASHCLISALNALHALRRGKQLHSGNESPPAEIDVATICRQIQSLLQIEHLACHQSAYLQLLTSLCQTYPAAAASQWHLFLEQSTAQAGGAAMPLLISFVEDGTSKLNGRNFESKTISLLPGALRTVGSLLSSIPFSHWIADDGKSPTKMSGQNYFASRVRNSMLRIMACVNSLMDSIRNCLLNMGSNNLNVPIELMDSIMIHTSQLTGKLCTILPFNGQNSVMLGPASKLVGFSGEIYVICTKAIEDSASLHPTSVKLKLHEKALNSFSNVITGTVDANPTTEKMDATTLSAAQHWISDCSSFEFIELLLSSKSTSFEEKRTAMLSHVARICPWALAQEPFNLASFCELCTTKCNDPELRVSGVKLVESFLFGRHVFSSKFLSLDMSNVIIDTLCPALLMALKHPEANVRTAGINSFSYMMETDWMALHSRNNEASSLDWHYIDAVLRMCLKDHENDSKVRCSACKAMGDISTCILKQCHHTNSIARSQFTHQFGIEFSQKICRKMEYVLKDDCSSVRSMGIFTIGNIAHALKEQQCSTEAILSLLPHLNISFHSLCACLDDNDDKVVVNAIRSLAHLSHFVYSPDFSSNTKSCDLYLYRDTISRLSIKVKRAVDDVTEGPSTQLTWNQRSNIKKHAWGSCSTIGVLLSFSNAVQELDSIFIESILLQLFRCVQVSNEIHDKIASAAVHSLVTLPNSFWHELPDDCSSIGFGLACCFCYLSNASKQKSTASSHTSGVNSMTRMLLSSAKSKDFCRLLLLRDDIPFSVDYFYQWLVTNNINAEVIEEIAIAAQSKEVQNHIDVSMVQMFMSRTLQTKDQASLRKSSLIDSINDDECDEI